MICITNRRICTYDFFETVDYASKKSDILILREKDLTEKEYLSLAEKVQEICIKNNCAFYVNSFIETAKKIHAEGLQLSFSDFVKYSEKNALEKIKAGCSVHSVQEAENACRMGADFLIAGHIFPTDCKKGVAPRGLDFLNSVVKISTVPVYAIGGISRKNLSLVLQAGAKDGCIMSAFMQRKI